MLDVWNAADWYPASPCFSPSTIVVGILSCGDSLWICCQPFIHSSVDRPLVCFQFVTINKTAGNILAHMSPCTHKWEFLKGLFWGGELWPHSQDTIATGYTVFGFLHILTNTWYYQFSLHVSYCGILLLEFAFSWLLATLITSFQIFTGPFGFFFDDLPVFSFSVGFFF